MESRLLKLGFKKGERVFIKAGDVEFSIIVNGYAKTKYSLLFDAPKEVRVIRETAKNQAPVQATKDLEIEKVI